MHLTKAQIDDLKARLDIIEVMRSVGVESRKEGRYQKARCPFHAGGKERTPSLIVDPKKQLFNCRGGCSAKDDTRTGVHAKSGGDVFTFWMKLTGQGFPEACEDLAQRFSITLTKSSGNGNGNGNGAHLSPEPAPSTNGGGARPALSPGYFSLDGSRIPRTIVWSQSVLEWIKQLSITRSAQEGLEARGLVTKEIWRGLKIGYSSGSLEDMCGTEASEAHGLLKSIGLLGSDGKETMNGRLVFPLLALNQLPVNVYGRSLRDDLHPHHRFNRGTLAGLWNQGAARRSKELLLVESVVCVCSLCEARVYDSMSLYGAHGPTEDLIELIRRQGVTSIVVGLDADETGRSAAPGIVETFRQIGLQARSIEWPEKDPNEILMRHGPDKLREIVEKLRAKALPRDVVSLPAIATVTVTASITPLVDDVASTSPDAPPLHDSARADAVPLGDFELPEPAPLKNVLTVSASIKEENSNSTCAAETTTVSEAMPLEPAADAALRSDAKVTSAASAPSPAITPSSPSTSLKSAPPEALSEDELRSKTLTVRYEDRRYGLTWLESPSVAQLRAHTRLELLPEAADEDALSLVTFLDSINLASGRSRDGFIRRVLSLVSPEAEKLLPHKDALLRLIEADLMHLYELGERRMKALLFPKTKANAMTDDRREQALSYLLVPDLLSRLAQDLDAMGYVGERRAKLLGYLVAISRKLPEAMSMVILSASGSGKSALAEVLERLTPEEDLLVVSRFTAASLYWMEKDAMKRKFVSIEERGGSDEADYAIRALQSKKQLTMMAPVKDQASGKLETKFFFVEGPTAFLESTTESQINHENATRCFEERLDESREQTRRIHEAQRKSKTPEGQRAKAKAEEIAALHRDVQRCLRVVKVSIPYADLLTFPSTWTRNRRDHPRFLNLIEVIAFLNQYQRPLRYLDTDEPCERTPHELTDEELSAVYVEASVDDYGAAKTLYGEILAETLAELKRPLRELLSVFTRLALEKKVRGQDNVLLLVRELRDATRLEQRVIRRYLAELVELEHLTQTRGPNGAANAYRLAELESRPAAEIEGLLSVEELRRLIEERKRKS
jgi:hypothetical protein